ncbi:hypothetical protein NWP21_08375 [Anabaenopsis sp. FSS-46]|nr:hypothetical protein [Anabaenopsis sp. FSS-46]MDH6098855.1 hypothetical protein [Anabaenopsis sp. FSS-46]
MAYLSAIAPSCSGVIHPFWLVISSGQTIFNPYHSGNRGAIAYLPN